MVRHQEHLPSKIEEVEEEVEAQSGNSEMAPAAPPVTGGDC